MNDYEARRAQVRKDQRKLRRRRRWEDRIATLLGVIGAVTLVVGTAAAFVVAFAVIGGLGVYAAWNLGVHGVAGAVHTSIGTISYWTAVGLSLAIGVLSRLFRSDSKIEAKKPA